MPNENSKPSAFAGWVGSLFGALLVFLAVLLVALWLLIPTDQQPSGPSQSSNPTGKPVQQSPAPQGGKQFNF